MPTLVCRPGSTTLIAIALIASVCAGPVWGEDALSAPTAESQESAAPQGMTILRVGTGPGCAHSTIQAAINAAPASVPVEIRVNQGTYNEAVTLSTNTFTTVFRGGYSNCMADNATGSSTIFAPPGARPLTIAASGSARFVIISGWNLTGGNLGSLEAGGGLLATASNASLQMNISSVFIETNDAGVGGGIAMQTFTANATVQLSLFSGTLLNSNNALSDGGGIWCAGPGTNTLSLNDVSIRNNMAGAPGGDNGRGGGLFANNCDVTWNGLRAGSGLADAPTLRNNTSYGRGGGIYANNGSTLVFRSSTSFGGQPFNDFPIRIRANRAIGPSGEEGVGQGGGIWLTNASLTANGIWIEENTATGNSGALYAIDGSQIRMDRNLAFPGAGEPSCHAAIDCSRIVENSAGDTGGAIYVRDSGTQAVIEQTLIRDNSAQAGTGASLFAQTGSDLTVLSSLLYGGNAPDGPPNYVFWVGNNAIVNLFWSTLVDNLPGSGVFRFGGSGSLLRLRGSIIYEPGRSMGVVSGTPTVDSDCVVWHSNSLMTSPYIFIGGANFHQVANPDFADAANRDYQLTQSSPAVDFCDSSIFPGNAPERDLVLRLRGQPVKETPLHGPYDLGAIEFLPDQIFRDRFQ